MKPTRFLPGADSRIDHKFRPLAEIQKRIRDEDAAFFRSLFTEHMRAFTAYVDHMKRVQNIFADFPWVQSQTAREVLQRRDERELEGGRSVCKNCNGTGTPSRDVPGQPGVVFDIYYPEGSCRPCGGTGKVD